MKITSIEARSYRLPLDPPFVAAWDPRPRTSFAETIVLVDTDMGVRGIAGGAPVPDLELLASLLVDRPVPDEEHVAALLATVDFHHGRNWTVEVAVHDALARAAGAPLWQYLGGSRTSIRAYASTGQRVSAEQRVERVLALMEAGITAVKLRFYHDDWREDAAVVAAVRAAAGSELDILVDANHGWRMPGDLARPWDLETAAACAAELAVHDVRWLEEPLPTADIGGLAALRQRSSIAIAGGEMVRSLAETGHLLDAGALDVVQNDVVLAGGISGARTVAQWAEASGAVWSPHTWSTGLGLLANLHAALAFSTADLLEVPYDPPEWSAQRRDFAMPEPLPIAADGTLAPPPGPGLGVEPEWEALERYRVG